MYKLIHNKAFYKIFEKSQMLIVCHIHCVIYHTTKKKLCIYIYYCGERCIICIK